MWDQGVLQLEKVALDDKGELPPKRCQESKNSYSTYNHYLFDRYLLSAYYVPATLLGTSDTAVTKYNPCTPKTYILVAEIDKHAE